MKNHNVFVVLGFVWRVIFVGAIIYLSNGCATDSATGGDDDGTTVTTPNNGSGSGSAMMPDAGTPDAPPVNACASYSWMTEKAWTCSNWNGNYTVTLTSNGGVCSLSIAGSGAREMTQVMVTRSDDHLTNKLVITMTDSTLTCFQNAN